MNRTNQRKKRRKDSVASVVDFLWWGVNTWGEKEKLAGVTDRNAFWEGKTEEQARAALRELIRERVVRGELDKRGAKGGAA